MRSIAPCFFLAILFIGALAATPRQAQAHIEEQYGSIHFNSGHPDFGTPPRRAALPWRGISDENNGDAISGEFYNRPCVLKWMSPNSLPSSFAIELTRDKDEWRDVMRERRQAALTRSAHDAIAAGRWRRARNAYQQMGESLGWTGSLRDRIEVLDHYSEPGVNPSPGESASLRRYLAALDTTTGPNHSDGLRVFDALAQITGLSPFLRGHALYQAGCTGYDPDTNNDYSLRCFRKLLHNYPKIKREAALLMIARIEIFPNDATNRELAAGANAIDQLLTEYPHSRMRTPAIGLRARIEYLSGRYDSAARMYAAIGDMDSLQQVRSKLKAGAIEDGVEAQLLDISVRRLLTAQRYETYARAAETVDLMTYVLTPNGARIFVRRLLSEPDLASAYFYYRLYHYKNTASQLENLAALADRIAATSEARAEQMPRDLQVRLAEIYYQRRDYKRALPWVDRALASREDAAGRDRALYVRGAIELNQRQYHSARADFDALLNGYPDSTLRSAAHEEIALEEEAVGNVSGALTQYFYLDYQPDIAYFLDARMTPSQIEAYLREYPHHPHHQLILYSLGMRYLRAERFEQARICFARLPGPIYHQLNEGRHVIDDEDVPVDGPSPDPLVAIQNLSRLRATADHAQGDAAQADAWYRYATYYYTHGTHLLYNDGLWHGKRADEFGWYWDPQRATAQDNEATYRHMYAHEVYARTEQICLKIVRRYPRTAVAPRALYRAACCEYRLSHFNVWWRSDRPDHRVRAHLLMTKVTQSYPNHPLATAAKKYALLFSGSSDDDP